MFLPLRSCIRLRVKSEFTCCGLKENMQCRKKHIFWHVMANILFMLCHCYNTCVVFHGHHTIFDMSWVPYYFGHIKAATVYLFRYVMAPTLFWYVMTYHNVVVCQGCHIYLACRSLSVSFCKELKTSLISFFTSLDNSLLVCNQLSQ